MDIELIKKVESTKGAIYLVDSNQIGIDRVRFKTKKDYQHTVVNAVLNSVIGEHKLNHEKNGAPYLENSLYNISISHCNTLFAIYLSENSDIGVDIETIKKDLNKGKAYFLNKREINKDWSFKELYLIWCAKEAIFKLERGKITDLANEVTILSYNSDQIFYSYNSNEKSLQYLSADNWILAFT
jgi:phosphopantetheinyl transferase